MADKAVGHLRHTVVVAFGQTPVTGLAMVLRSEMLANAAFWPQVFPGIDGLCQKGRKVSQT